MACCLNRVCIYIYIYIYIYGLNGSIECFKYIIKEHHDKQELSK